LRCVVGMRVSQSHDGPPPCREKVERAGVYALSVWTVKPRGNRHLLASVGRDANRTDSVSGRSSNVSSSSLVGVALRGR
jgi:hypothetical protein